MTTKAKEPKYVPLCYRCEYRARFKETNHGPRYECGADGAVYSCYMYRPVSPVILRRAPRDKRPVNAPAMIRARLVGSRVAECDTLGMRLNEKSKKAVEHVVLAVPVEAKKFFRVKV